MRKFKERIIASPYEVDVERGKHYTRVWRETEDGGPCMRAARALEETLRSMSLRIEEEELLAGVRTYKFLSAALPVERHVVADSGRFVPTTNRVEATGEEKEELEAMRSYWIGRTAHDAKIRLWEEAGLVKAAANPFGFMYDGGLTALDTQGHTIPGFPRVLELGFDRIEEMAAEGLSELNPSGEGYEHQRDFLTSVPVTSRAVRELALRYAELAEQQAAAFEGERRTELLEIAERCRKVPAKPAGTFMEAAQSVWLSMVALHISYGYGDAFSSGRLDQYLHSYYQADLAEGRITPQRAQEVVSELHLKMSTYIMPAANNITIGGLGRDGEDATNEISYMFLNAIEELGGLRGNLSVRVSRKTPRDFLLRAFEVHRRTAGIAFFNDEIIVRDMLADGYAPEDAWDYSLVGCVEPNGTGNDFSYTAGNAVSLVQALEMALNEGRRVYGADDRQVGAPTPPRSELRSFEAVKEAFAQQLSFCIAKCVDLVELKDRVYAESLPSPLLSSTIVGCLENGRDITRGGATYNNGHVGTQALATAVNSLAAIRWAVFEEKKMTLDEIVEMMRNDFRDSEPIRQELLRKSPKFGNDDRITDDLAVWIVELFCEEVRKHRCGRGGVYRPLILSSGFQVVEGFLCPATPDGRRAGEPVSDGISPGHHTEGKGLTALMHSAAKASSPLVTDGTTLTVTLSPGLLTTDEGLEKMASLLEGYFELGGRHVQFTPLSAETLQDAQAHPEKYPDLTVKVSGYSAVFVDLPVVLQNDIIGRTEFETL
jgi:formate C-acetyltransferase